MKAHASSTKSQQLRVLKFLFYTALQITFLFRLLTRCKLHAIFHSGSESSTLFSLSGAKVPGDESSME